MKVCHITRHRINVDGQDIRTLIVLKDCNLRCKFCINPETWNNSPNYIEYSEKELFDKIIIDKTYFIAINGGVTFGGGEPLLYGNEIAEFARLVNKEFSIYLETSLNVDTRNLLSLKNLIDIYYVDIKTMNPDIYREYTGGSLDVILSNLKFLLENKKI